MAQGPFGPPISFVTFLDIFLSLEFFFFFFFFNHNIKIYEKKTIRPESLILKGISLHLKGVSLNKINDYYNSNFKKQRFTKKDISFVTYFTNISIRHRGQIEKIIKNYIKKKSTQKYI